jgi:hypothetical protein
MEIMSYSLTIRFNILPRNLTVNKIRNETNLVAQEILGVPLNFDFYISKNQIKPSVNGKKNSLHEKQRFDELVTTYDVYSLTVLDDEANILYNTEEYMPELGKYYFSISHLRFNTKKPTSMVALFLAIGMARLLNVSSIEDSSGIWMPKNHQGQYDNIDLTLGLDIFKLPTQKTSVEAMNTLYALSRLCVVPTPANPHAH